MSPPYQFYGSTLFGQGFDFGFGFSLPNPVEIPFSLK